MDEIEIEHNENTIISFIDTGGVGPRIKNYWQIDPPANICLFGEPGGGKNKLVQEVAGVENLLSLSAGGLTPTSLTGFYKPAPRGEGWLWEDGKLVRAMQDNKVFLLDDVDTLRVDSKDCWDLLRPVLDDRRTLLRPNRSEVCAGPGFRFVVTCNLSHADAIPPEVRDRFAFIYVQPIDRDREIQVLVQHTKIDAKDAEWLVDYAHVLRDSLGNGVASLRSLLRAARGMSIGLPRDSAAEDNLLGSSAGPSLQSRRAALAVLRAEGLVQEPAIDGLRAHEFEVAVEEEELWT